MSLGKERYSGGETQRYGSGETVSIVGEHLEMSIGSTKVICVLVVGVCFVYRKVKGEGEVMGKNKLLSVAK